MSKEEILDLAFEEGYDDGYDDGINGNPFEENLFKEYIIKYTKEWIEARNQGYVEGYEDGTMERDMEEY